MRPLTARFSPIPLANMARQMKNGGFNAEMVIDGRLQIYFYGCQINERTPNRAYFMSDAKHSARVKHGERFIKIFL